MIKKDIVINTEAGKIIETRMITAEVTGAWADGTTCWTDEEGNQYTYHRKKVEGHTITYFLLEAIDELQTSWKI